MTRPGLQLIPEVCRSVLDINLIGAHFGRNLEVFWSWFEFPWLPVEVGFEGGVVKNHVFGLAADHFRVDAFPWPKEGSCPDKGAEQWSG